MYWNVVFLILVSVNVSASVGTYYAYETVVIACTTSLANLTIQIFVKKTVGATYNGLFNTFSTGVIASSYVDTGTEIIYTWTIITGQIVNCVSGSYAVTAQYNLVGTAQITSADTYVVTTTTTGGVTTTFTGHF